ncbi:DUF2332 family protein [Sandarakinorhabdus sp. AAP62]|uniref:DUF2332 domain-containing protein n=1 Tax=Sandarakinorhabdus sp. AAP62 TaxID=1248916 RepID=UPI00047756AD|nr:DUF2332 family protein [Sandarakinorhabdus sp. AAP62]
MAGKVATALEQQARFCAGLGAPFTGALCRVLAGGVDPASLTGQRLGVWPGEPMTDALPMRLTGALHWLVRAGRVPVLAALYPPAAMPDDAALAAALAGLFADPAIDAAICDFLDSPPQTNEVGRSGALMPALLTLVAATGQPLALHELGASAGLNLNLDRFAFDLGGITAGDPASAVRIAPHWHGPPPPAAALQVAARAGVDIAPLDASDAAVAERLMAFIWADQPERLARTEAAIALARAFPPPLEQGDAADWLERTLRLADGVTTVVYHSIAFQYFPPSVQARVMGHLAKLGATATPQRPLAWLRMEMDDPANPAMPAIRLSLWRGAAEESQLLGHAHAHGTFVHWTG